MPETDCKNPYFSSFYSAREAGYWKKGLTDCKQGIIPSRYFGGQVKYLLTSGDYLRYKRFLLRNMIPHCALNALNLLQIRNSLNQLKSAEKRVAECVLRDPHQVIRYTITELADKADTSEPTAVRFCRKLGLQGYMDLRLSLARDLPSAQYIYETVDEQDSPVQVMNKIFSANREALGVTLNKIDMTVFGQAVNILEKARRIEF